MVVRCQRTEILCEKKWLVFSVHSKISLGFIIFLFSIGNISAFTKIDAKILFNREKETFVIETQLSFIWKIAKCLFCNNFHYAAILYLFKVVNPTTVRLYYGAGVGVWPYYYGIFAIWTVYWKRNCGFIDLNILSKYTRWYIK